MRRFAIENGKAVISGNGEFLHINDINLLLIEERHSVQNMIDLEHAVGIIDLLS